MMCPMRRGWRRPIADTGASAPERPRCIAATTGTLTRHPVLCPIGQQQSSANAFCIAAESIPRQQHDGLKTDQQCFAAIFDAKHKILQVHLIVEYVMCAQRSVSPIGLWVAVSDKILSNEFFEILCVSCPRRPGWRI